MIDKAKPNMFSFYAYKDTGTTGRLEVTVYSNSKTDAGKGVLIHSKHETGKLPTADWDDFMKKLEAKIK